MSASIIDGKKIAAEIQSEISVQVRRFVAKYGIKPGLAFILVGEDPASQIYVQMKGKACDEVGFYSVTERLPADVRESDVINIIHKFNQDSSIHGILIQLPLPPHVNEQKIIESIDPSKDVDGFHPYNVGKMVLGLPSLRPCTPSGIQELLVRSGHNPKGKHVVVVGRSNIVGKPVANILFQKQMNADAIVTVAHTGAEDISSFTKMADILIVSMGKPNSITGDMLKKGVIVVDVGINRIADTSSPKGYRIVGDVDFESANKVAHAITPVPGGVGPMTIAMLLRNTFDAAKNIQKTIRHS